MTERTPALLLLGASLLLLLDPAPGWGQRKQIDDIRRKFAKQKQAILGDFEEFTAEVERYQPGLKLSIPVSPRTRGLSLKRHDGAPGQRSLQRVYAFVVHSYSMRSQPNRMSTITGVAQSDEKVEVKLMIRRKVKPGQTRPLFHWCLVERASGGQGYIPSTYLRLSLEEDPKKTSKEKEVKYVIALGGLRMRDAAGLHGKYMQTLPYRTEVNVERYSRTKMVAGDKRDYWALVVHSGQRGWVFNAYLRSVRPKKVTPKKSKKPFYMPVGGRISSYYGYRIDPITKKAGRFHRGMDFAVPRGTPIRAAASGQVVTSKWDRRGYYGHFIAIDHGKKLYTYYLHQSRRRARRGQRVRRGQVIGYVGSTGRSTGPHLHFEVRIGRRTANPAKFLPL